jgi:DNA-binding response OmpR family regulator
MDKKRLMLVVEDENAIRKAIVLKFNKEGFDVLEAKNGEEGLDVFIKERPEIILLDLVMPVMGGMEMLKKLRKCEGGNDVPVIIFTNLSEAEQTAEGLEFGVRDYLVKSDWKLEDVVQIVRSKLGKK